MSPRKHVWIRRSTLCRRSSPCTRTCWPTFRLRTARHATAAARPAVRPRQRDHGEPRPCAVVPPAFRIDDWLLYSMDGPNAGARGARGFFARGELVQSRTAYWWRRRHRSEGLAPGDQRAPRYDPRSNRRDADPRLQDIRHGSIDPPSTGQVTRRSVRHGGRHRHPRSGRFFAISSGSSSRATLCRRWRQAVSSWSDSRPGTTSLLGVTGAPAMSRRETSCLRCSCAPIDGCAVEHDAADADQRCCSPIGSRAA